MPLKGTGVIHNEVINTDSVAALFFEKSQRRVCGCRVGVIAPPWGHLKMSGIISLIQLGRMGWRKVLLSSHGLSPGKKLNTVKY